jgi:nucleoside-diphosphate-sugar epimerase
VSYVYAGDLVRAVVDAAASGRARGNTYFVCNDRPATWQEIHETVFALALRRTVSLNLPLPLLMPFSVTAAAAARILGRPAPLLRPQGLRLSRHDWIASNAAARRDFGFAPKHDLKTGLERTYQWYREAGKL